MGRLIDAGKILDNLSGMLKRMDDYDAVRKVINDIPTAYDPDKVVEQLKEACISPSDYPGYVVDIEKAIEIVKAAGINDPGQSGK